MNTGQPLLKVADLECVRDGRLLFRDLHLQLGCGELLSLQGANGAGKSTLLRCIAGLYPDFEGSLVSAPLVYSGHKAGLCAALSTAENLQFLAGLEHARQMPAVELLAGPAAASVVDALVCVGLAGYEDVRCSALSAGQLRRVGLARLLLSQAPLWLLDEPLTALDQAGVELLGAVLARHLEAGGGAVCATHQRLPVERYSVVELTSTGAVSIPCLSTVS